MPILANVKLSAEGESLKVAATDLEVSLTGEATAKVKVPGAITIDARGAARHHQRTSQY